MKIFKWGGKLNFVDENNVFVGFDYEGCCCEQYGAIISDKRIPITEIVGMADNYEDENLDGYVFDKKYIRKKRYEETAIGVFKLVNGSNIKYLTIYNAHNGYYGHGFVFAEGATFEHNPRNPDEEYEWDCDFETKYEKVIDEDTL